MTPSGELFKLIKSMSQAEKTYFKKYSRMHTVGKENTYLLLFDAIVKQDEYDEKKLLLQLEKHDFVKHFAVVKKYLYERILDALESYHRDANVHTQVRRAITRAEILHRRGLYGQSVKLVEKTRRIAKEFDLHHALLEIYSTLDLILYTEKNEARNLQQLYGKTTESFASIRENMRTHNLFTRMVDCYYNYSQTRNEKYRSTAEKLVRSKLFKDASNSQTFMGKLRFYETNFSYSYMKSDLDQSYRFESLIVSLFDSSPVHLRNNVKKYISAINNLIVISGEQNRMRDVHIHLKQLDAAAHYAKSHSQKAMLFYYRTVNSLHYFCLTGNTAELRKNLASSTAEIHLYENEFNEPEKIDILIHFAISCYYCSDLKKCQSHLNKLRNEFDLSRNPEAQSFFYIFYLIVHYDAGNREILFSAMQSYYRFLQKKEKVSRLEKAIILMLRRQSKIDSPEKIREQFMQFRDLLLTIEQSYLDKYIFKYVDFISWLESKIENKPFADIVKKKMSHAGKQNN